VLFKVNNFGTNLGLSSDNSTCNFGHILHHFRHRSVQNRCIVDGNVSMNVIPDYSHDSLDAVFFRDNPPALSAVAVFVSQMPHALYPITHIAGAPKRMKT